MLGLVGQVRPPVFHLRHPRIRIVRMGPFGVRRLLRARSVEPRQLGSRRRRHARRLGQPRQERDIIQAIDVVTGEELWRRRLIPAPAPKYMLGGTDKQHLYHNSTLALHGDTGEIVW